MQEPSPQFIQIDEAGFFHVGENRITDTPYALDLFKNLQKSENGAFETFSSNEPEKKRFVEAFDAPFVVHQLEKTGPKSWILKMPYGLQKEFEIQTQQNSCTNLSLDEWDRFHGVFENELPFVFSRPAQSDFFEQVDDFDDTGLFISSDRFEIPNWLETNPSVEKENFWSEIYRNEEPRWDLGKPNPILKDIIPQLKLPRSKILVLGCGSGNDAAHLARCGHIVTAIDFSPEAIGQAKERYSDVPDLQFELADVFHLSEKYHGQFDLVFEHTLYCAINPSQRTQLTKIWKACLAPSGHLLGIFFAHHKPFGPPYGGSEWEVQQRLHKNGFKPLYWNRWRHSLEKRMGKELVVYAQKTT